MFYARLHENASYDKYQFKNRINLSWFYTVKDDCASGPCQYGTCHNKDDGFQCNCVFFSEGKLCSKRK